MWVGEIETDCMFENIFENYLSTCIFGLRHITTNKTVPVFNNPIDSKMIW